MIKVFIAFVVIASRIFSLCLKLLSFLEHKEREKETESKLKSEMAVDRNTVVMLVCKLV